MNDNKLIAEFMGSKTIRINVPFEYELGEELPTSTNICNSIVDAMEEVQTEVDEGIISGCDLCMKVVEYHTSWDWLMPVVEKIECTHDDKGDCFNVMMEAFECTISGLGLTLCLNGHTKMDATYKAVVEFIKRYSNE